MAVTVRAAGAPTVGALPAWIVIDVWTDLVPAEAVMVTCCCVAATPATTWKPMLV